MTLPRPAAATGRASAGVAGLMLLAASLAFGATLEVGSGRPYATVAAALAAADTGDVIEVGAGIYRERGLVVRKPVTLRGKGFPVLDADGSESILDIRADGVTVEGLAFRGVAASYVRDNSAILLTAAADAAIRGNRFEACFFAVFGARARRVEVSGNLLEGLHAKEHSNGNGIHFWRSDSVTVTGNRVRGHRDGIYLEFTGNTRVEGNTCESNARYGLHFMYSHRNVYRKNAFRGNGAGVAVMYSEDVDMEGNVFERNWGPGAYGLLLKSISRSRIEGNEFSDNTVAVFLEDGNALEVKGNLFRRNGWAFRITADSEDNRVEGNRFEGNSFDVAYNASTGNSNVFRRNRWDRYEGWDLDRDGVGDVAHRPVELFPALMQKHPQAMVLLRSHLASLLNVLETMFPTLSPASLEDTEPLMPGPAARPEAT